MCRQIMMTQCLKDTMSNARVEIWDSRPGIINSARDSGGDVTVSETFELWKEVKFFQSRLTLCDSMDYRVHGILQARILEWVAIPFSRGSHQPRNRTRVSCIAGGFFTNWAIREAHFEPWVFELWTFEQVFWAVSWGTNRNSQGRGE